MVGMRLARVVSLVAALSLASAAVGAREEDAPLGEEARDEVGLPIHRLTSGREIDAMPSWAPDGRRIVFHSRRPPEKGETTPTRKIWIMDADGKNARKLSHGFGDEYHPVFSPDGRKIAFVSETNGNRDIWVMDADGANPIPLTDDPGIEEHPCWSPDGKQIAYTALPKEGGNFDLWVMNADGSGRRKITYSAANEVFPAWHPKGDVIAFATDQNGNFDVFGISLADERVFPIVAGAANETRPAWSPDGTKIAFSRWPAGGRSTEARVWVANADGSVPTELPTPASALHPAWSPDGFVLAFQRKEEVGWNLYSARLPEFVVKEGRLHLARQMRGRAEQDVVRLRGGEALYGRIAAARLVLRTSYAQIPFPRQWIASVELASLEKGTAKIILTNGDSFTGFLVDDAIDFETARGKESIRKEKIEAIGFRLRQEGSSDEKGDALLLMRNGDAFSGKLKSRAVRLRVGSQSIETAMSDVARIEFGEEGAKTRVVTRKGDMLSGRIESSLVELDLPSGAALSLSPPYVRTLTLPESGS